HVVGCRDVDRVQIFLLLVEQLTPVLVDADVGKVLLQRLAARRIHVRHANQLRRTMAGNRPQVRPRHSRCPKTGVAHRLARRRGPKVPDESRCGNTGSSSEFKEPTAGGTGEEHVWLSKRRTGLPVIVDGNQRPATSWLYLAQRMGTMVACPPLSPSPAIAPS